MRGRSPASRSVVNGTQVTVPVLESAEVDGGSLAMRYGEALDEGSVPSAGDFDVVVGRTRSPEWRLCLVEGKAVGVSACGGERLDGDADAVAVDGGGGGGGARLHARHETRCATSGGRMRRPRTTWRW